MGKSDMGISMFNLRYYLSSLMKFGIVKLMNGNWSNTAAIFHGHQSELTSSLIITGRYKSLFLGHFSIIC
jgi:hypothetical protein